MKPKTITIRINPATRELLKAFGSMGETYDDVIKTLLIRGVILSLAGDLGTSLQPAFDKFWSEIYPQWQKEYGFKINISHANNWRSKILASRYFN